MEEQKSDVVEQLGPQTRIQAELTKLETQNRDVWVLIVFAAAVVALGALSLLAPSSFWHENSIELKLSPQVLFVFMMVVMVISLYVVRREMETRKLRLSNLQRSLVAQAEYSASMVDSLTNVFNRSFLRELLQGEIARAERNARPLGLIMCDINNFKDVNDRFGHLMGDYVLAQIAGILKSCVRGSDYVVRYGGDEFLIILSETDEPGSNIVRGRIQRKVADWDRANRIGDFPISVSMGVFLHVPGRTAEQDVAEADARMYSDKQSSRRNSDVPNKTPARL